MKYRSGFPSPPLKGPRFDSRNPRKSALTDGDTRKKRRVPRPTDGLPRGVSIPCWFRKLFFHQAIEFIS